MNWGILIVIGIIVIILEVASQSVRNKKTNEKLQQSKNLNVDKTNTVDVEEEKRRKTSALMIINRIRKSICLQRTNFIFTSSCRRLQKAKIYFLLQKSDLRTL